MRGIRNEVRAYYSDAIERFGPAPLGVDWPNQASQYLRFVQLLKICDFGRPFSLNDFGCGYGALLGYLALRHSDASVTYRGIDLSAQMIAVAKQCWAARPNTTFVAGYRCGKVADYSMASGVFNVRLGQIVEEWEAYIESILLDLRSSSRIGLAVNFMLPLDNAPMENELYRTSLNRWVTYCRRKLGCTVRPITRYGLREFTLLARVRK